MTHPHDPQARLAAIEAQVREAHRAASRGDAPGAGWRARAATEAMLQLLADAHDVDVPHGPTSPATLETLRKALRHAKVLDRKLEDHVDYIQRVGNRAAHAQRDPEHHVDLNEMRGVLAALDHLQGGVRARFPAPEAPPPKGRPWLGLGLAVLAVPIAPLLAFYLASAVVGAGAPPPPPPAAEPAPVQRGLVDAALLEQMLADEGPAALRGEDAAVVTRAILDGTPVDPERLARLDCPQLILAHDGVWARHGYAFSDPDALRALQAGGRYTPWRGPDVPAVRAAFTPTDRTNLARIRALLGARDCACNDEGPCQR